MLLQLLQESIKFAYVVTIKDFNTHHSYLKDTDMAYLMVIYSPRLFIM